MSLKALSDYTIYSRYAHYLPEKKRRETWEEITERVFAMHERKYAKALENPEFKADFEFAKEMVKKKRVLGSQRALQFGGKWIEDHNLKLYNCCSTHINRPRAFQEAMYTLLCGTGMGFSVQKQHITNLPRITAPSTRTKTYQIPDTIEGWSDAIGVLLASYFTEGTEFSEYRCFTVKFDYSKIRPEGALIAGQFKAPGYKGLETALERIRGVLNRRLEQDSFKSGEFSGKIRPIDAYDCIMHASDAVLSGGVRRSATICLFSLNDNEMRDAKTGNWFAENPQRARSNNSAALSKKDTTREQFAALMKSTREFGEPGFIWLDNMDTVFNPCCLSPDTRIETKRGTVPISDVIVGDYVLSFNEQTDKNEWKRVVFSGKTRTSAEVISITTECGKNLICTPDHKIYNPVFAEYITANKIVKGFLLYPSGEDATLCVVKDVVKSPPIDVYDITVEDNHNFYAEDILVHNCEIGMLPHYNGESGIQGCNLVEINGKYCDTEERFLECCRAAAFLGTIQAGYTDFKYLTPVSKSIFDREALLGCSITGIMDNTDILLNATIQRKGAKSILEHNARIANIIGINPTARATCVKPSGSTSCLLKTASGIHPHHAKRYIRRVQENRNEFPLRLFKQYNPLAVEPSVWSANGTDEVISFICEVPPGAKLKNDLPAIDFLSQARIVQTNWVEAGTRPEMCVDPNVRHNVSMTAVVKDDEWDKVEDYIFKHRKDFAGISLLSASGDLDYPQAPLATVLTPEEIVREYGDGSVIAAGLVVDGLAAFNDNLWKACDAVLGLGDGSDKPMEPEEPKKPRRRDHKTEKAYTTAMTEYALKLNHFYARMGEYRQQHVKADWVRRAKQFAERYFDNDVRKATYCLKHVSLWHTWLTLRRTYKDIDWSTVVEETQAHVGADTLGAQACSGGQCNLI